jgi:hypothetical protein
MDKILVVQACTHEKEYCRSMYPKFADNLTYENKDLIFIDEKRHPFSELKQLGIEEARRGNYDWLLFLDLDTEPDPDIIEKMLACEAPLVGAMHAELGNANKCIGHNYKDRKSLERLWLTKAQLMGMPEVDCVSGGILLIAKGIYMRVDYSGYTGANTIPGRYTTEDEYLLIKIYNSLKIRPVVATNARSWHYSDDGRAYRLWGEVKQWKKY